MDQEIKEPARLAVLRTDEKTIQKKWADTKAHDITMDITKQKYFSTFPFPYSNGRLHLGHGYTISKAEFDARYHKLKGFHVLFPFAFHATGTPIASSANKVNEYLSQHPIDTINIETLEQGNQIKTLLDMGVLKEEIPKFVDPYYWIQYFPEVSIKDLKAFGIMADFNRSFITTDINPHFDSFVRWQFNILHQKGYLTFGSKPVIYSPKDGQACADHDRSVGEGVGIKEFNVSYAKLNHNTLNEYYVADKLKLVLTDVINVDNIKLILVHPEDTFNIIGYDDNILVAKQDFFRNLQYQTDTLLVPIDNQVIKGQFLIGSTIVIDDHSFTIQEFKGKLPGSGVKIIQKDKKDKDTLITTSSSKIEFKYYEPVETVVSRTGDECVVAVVEQWFIDYGKPDVKQKVNDYIENGINTFSLEVKNMLKAGSNWIKEWPCSRSFGLGTKLLDSEYLIDSLSDSTIYMAYYTVAHKITQLPTDLLNYAVWEFIFKNGNFPLNCKDYIELINEMRNEFKYWYPVNLRVSGKDLVQNHLTMCLYNHFMIWDNDKLLPKNYFVNGHLLLNNRKMAKRDGNFMTLSDAVNKYGSSATRFALASAGSGIEDANFDEKTADVAVFNLTNERRWIMEMLDDLLYVNKENKENKESKTNNFWDDVFINNIHIIMHDVTKYYDKMEYQKGYC